MPTYDYVCDACHDSFEHFQGISEPLLLKCRECGKRKLRRLIGSGAGILFKGSGFYETDYKRASGASGKTGNDIKDDKSSGDGTPAAGGGKQDKSGSGGDTPPKQPAEKKPADGGKAGHDGKPGKPAKG
ncbi:MAG: FmdB family zinc ribbon protein [Planctomycetota bacterium]